MIKGRLEGELVTILNVYALTLTLMAELVVIDVWRELNPKGKDYTHFSAQSIRILKDRLFPNVQ